MRIGCIFVAWQSEDLLPQSLTPWVEARRARLGGHDFVIAAVCTPFEGFENAGPRDGTERLLLEAKERGDIDTVITLDNPVKETVARGLALSFLVGAQCDLIWQADSDEIPTLAQIAAVVSYVEVNPLYTWYRLCYRNAVFTPDQYLAEPFTPPRIHRVQPVGSGDYRAEAFWDDNNVSYSGSMGGRLDVQFASVTVPQSVSWIRHLSWLNDERSCTKIRYQLEGRRWPECSFRWDDKTGLVFNEQYYSRRGLPLPEVLRD